MRFRLVFFAFCDEFQYSTCSLSQCAIIRITGLLQFTVILLEYSSVCGYTYFCMRQWIIFLWLLLPILSEAQASAEIFSVLNEAEVRTQLINLAKSHLGVPYRYGGADPNGFDCSGLVCYVYAKTLDIVLPRTVPGLYNLGNSVDQNAMLPGDLCFFNTVGYLTHIGLYIGDRKVIHAASAGPNTGIIISSLDERYYRETFLGGRRIIAQKEDLKTVQSNQMNDKKQESKKDDKNTVIDKKTTEPIDSIRVKIVETARKFLGTPYHYSSATKYGCDSKGYIVLVYKEAFQVRVPWTLSAQLKAGTPVDAQSLSPGDVLFFRKGDEILEAGIYLGDNQFIHCSNRGKRNSVTITALNDPDYSQLQMLSCWIDPGKF